MSRKKKMNQQPINVGEAVKICVEVTIKKFLNSEELKEWEYPSSFTAKERAYIHNEAKKYGLKSKSRGKGSSRYLTIYKREASAIMEKDATMSLTPASRTLMMSMLTKHPVTTRERQDCLPPVERCKDLYQDGKDGSRALGRMSGGTPQVPPPVTTKAYAQFRASLPVAALQDIIVQTVAENQVTIIAGETGSGKTTQVPQFLLEWHEKTGRPCRIVCSQPRRISAVSVAERVATERGDKVGQSVGYQIRLEGKVSPYTVLMYCTNGVLLRTLMTGESVLATVTHIIVDEVHERDRLSDFVLIVLREALAKFRSLRLILMSATADSSTLSSYFNNCPVITVPGKLFEVKEHHLEDILKQTGYMTSEMEKMRKDLEKKKAQAAQLDKWAEAVRDDASMTSSASAQLLASNSTQGHEDVGTCKEMDEAIQEAWLTASDAAFAQLLYLLQNEVVNVDYQHSNTGISSLMVAAARGSAEVIEQLLALGANLLLEASNGYSAIKFAECFNRVEIVDILRAHETLLAVSNFDSNTNEIAVERKLSDVDKELLELYHCSFNDNFIDMKLLMVLISQIHVENINKGSILVFLPGYEDIMTLKELLISEERRMSQKTKVLILMLHSNMQTSEQKLVFKPTPINTRKIILSTNIAETSITIDDISYVIDTGKMKEKSYNALTGVSQLCTVWVSKSCAIQRKGRAGRTGPGICYRLYSSLRYEALQQHATPEILRVPLQELCLYAKQLAPPNTSIVDFLSRALDPPSSMASRSAVSLLKTIDALDTWEDLTDLGHHLLDFPIEPRYGKMLIYASVLKCLDPVLTIVCCLSYRDVFILPMAAGKKKDVHAERARFAAGSLSDHMVLLRVFQSWQEARKQGRGRQFCQQHYINGAAMEMILGTRAQVLAQLRASGFIKSKGHGDIKYVNANSDNWAVVKAAIAGGLYPNIARVDRQHNILRTVKEHKVRLHCTSVLHDGNKGSVTYFPTEWVAFEELSRSSTVCHIRTATVLSPITVAVFASPRAIPYDALSDTHIEGSLCSDSEEEEVGPEETATLKVDDWATFRTDSETAQLALQLRVKWHSLLSKKLRWTHKVLNTMDELVINTIVRVLSAEEQAARLSAPPGVGKRPYLMTPDLPAIGNRTLDYSDGLNDSHNDRRNQGTASPSKSNFERFNNGTNKSFEETSPTQTAFSSGGIEAQRANCASPFRYFVIKAGQLKNIDISVVHKMWAFLPTTQSRLVQALKAGKSVILVFSIQGSGHFQGYAHLAGENPVTGEIPLDLSGNHSLSAPLPVEWIKRGNIPYHATRHLFNPYNDYAKVQTSRDGQEIEPSVGEALCQLWDSLQWFPRPARVVRPTPYHASSYKM
ncbi:unnamed protein product [Nezara viridula]|uniref:RNA helicase n=1 Tax=Nezara viridula TaxID=85310 RepID=A0A9P0HKS0_NEZVI|nr:unnamed protein product [Nezara viridula]